MPLPTTLYCTTKILALHDMTSYRLASTRLLGRVIVDELELHRHVRTSQLNSYRIRFDRLFRVKCDEKLGKH